MGRRAVTDEQVLHAMGIDDAYHVERVLAKNATGITELVTIDGAGPFVRKKIATQYARRAVWASLLDCASLRLPQVVATYELPDSFVVVYDFIPGTSVKESIESAGPMEPREATTVVRDICEAVQVLHEHGIIHRDISPGNIVLAADGAHLIDLGIARMRNESATRDTTSLGTYGFASPEQYGFAQTDARSDVYSIGCLLGYLLTGLSSDKDGYEAELESVKSKQVELYQTIKKACAFEPSGRYQSAEELAGALGAAFNSAPTKPNQEAMETLAGKTKASKKIFLLAAAAICCMVAVALGMYLWRAGTQNPSVQNSVPSTAKADYVSEAPSTAAATGNTASESSVDAAKLIGVDSADFSLDSNGYIQYAFVATNTSSSQSVEYPLFEVTGYDEAGSVLFVDTQYLAFVGAGQTVAGSGIVLSSVVPTWLECSVKSDSATTVLGGVEPASFVVQNTAARASTSGGVVITGKLSLEKEGNYTSGLGEVVLTAVFKDEAGNIIGGSSVSVVQPSKGSTTPFEINVVGLSNYATFEVFAMQM